ncbi:MAG: RICIN domain-containing protein [Eggerthellaceae bacterium]|nr:RICIN domain-containing protein [Eggerthellaceae bacterium]
MIGVKAHTSWSRVIRPALLAALLAIAVTPFFANPAQALEGQSSDLAGEAATGSAEDGMKPQNSGEAQGIANSDDVSQLTTGTDDTTVGQGQGSQQAVDGTSQLAGQETGQSTGNGNVQSTPDSDSTVENQETPASNGESQSTTTPSTAADTQNGTSTQQATSTASDKNETQANTAATSTPNTGKGDLAPGKYFIVSAVNTRQVLDVSGASKADLGNVIVWHGTGNANQQWSITLDKDGYAIIKSVNSGKVLDVEGASGKKGANVIQYKANAGKNQKWIIRKYGDAYVVISALNSNLVLDLTGGSAKDNTNVEIWTRNNNKNQLFRFIPITPVQATPGKQVLPNGVYVVKAVSANNTAVDVEGGSTSNGANVLTWKASGRAWQAWYLAYDKAGYYTITSVNSGRQLAPTAVYSLNGINVGQYSLGSVDRAKWKITSAGNNQYVLTNKATGTSLAVGSMDKNNSANVQMTRGSNKFTFTAKAAMPSGAAIIEVSANTRLALDVYDNSLAKNAKLGTYSETGTLNQRYLITPLNGGYTIRPYNSRLYLTASASGVLTQEAARADMQNQIWNVKESRGLVTFVNATTGKAITVTGNAKKASATLSTTKAADNSAAQKFYVRSVAAVPDGMYYIGLSHAQSMVIDVVGGNRKNNANVDLWAKNGGNNQKFVITSLGGGKYKIANAVTTRVLDVSKTATKSGANVSMQKWNGGANQKWRIELNPDFSLSIYNSQTGFSLDTAKSSTEKGANVVVSTSNSDSKTQKYWIQIAVRKKESVIIGVPCYMQNPELPTGCESVALTNALRYWGYKPSKTTIADSYMPYGDNGVYNFIGSPYDYSGWIICAPGITNTANKYLKQVGSDVVARNVTGTSLSGLRTYLDRGQPVIVWTTIDMGEPGGVQWYSDGYPLRNNNHAVVLTGYDPFDNSYKVADSLAGIIWRSGSRFEYLYEEMGRQAVVLDG